MKAHIQVQSKSAVGEVGKLSNRDRGPFQIFEVLGNNSYHVQRYNNVDSSMRKYIGTDLYTLPSLIFQCDPLDTMNVRYLNYSNASVVSTFEEIIKYRHAQ